DADGNFMLVWSEHVFDTAIKGRVFNAFGVPLGASFVIASSTSSPNTEVIAERSGGFTVLWQVSTTLFRRRYTAGGQPLGLAEVLTNGVYVFDSSAAAHDDNGTVAVWVDAEARIQAGIFYPGAAPVLFRVHTYSAEARNRFLFTGRIVDVASRADGSFLVSWRDMMNNRPAVFVRAYDGEGQPLGEPLRADELTDAGPLDLAGIASTADASGDFLVAWQGNPAHENAERTLYVRALGPDGAPRGPVREAGDLAREPSFPVLASSPEGGSLLVWQDGQESLNLGSPPIPVCFSDGIYAQPLFAACGGGENLCLQDGRFQVQVAWSLPDGQRGQGQAVALTRESGYFWFFGANNVEVAVKILDGRIENGHFWVFYGSLSDVGYTITVTDTVTGASKTYVNPHSTLASRSDITAFPAAPAAGSRSAVVSAPSHLPPADGAGPCTDPALPVVRRPGLCLNGERFEVEVAWHDTFHGTSGIATGVPLTEDSGYFWFFGEDNLELVIKVLDGRSYNGKYWVFYGALSNVEYTIRVRHADSGAERIYHNPAGRFLSRSDIDAFVIAE
ncbi:MAG TPA: hypothetical protein VMW27_31145, partial [Thermoanaerobaculia bacterium]|nr:hypothetical protein [Thermoanaerobaculia bacterium]